MQPDFDNMGCSDVDVFSSVVAYLSNAPIFSFTERWNLGDERSVMNMALTSLMPLYVPYFTEAR